MGYAWVVDDKVYQIIEVPEGLSIADLVHPDIADSCFEASEEVDQGWTYAEGIFSPPEA